jgi:hypothetical protein
MNRIEQRVNDLVAGTMAPLAMPQAEEPVSCLADAALTVQEATAVIAAAANRYGVNAAVRTQDVYFHAVEHPISAEGAQVSGASSDILTALRRTLV